MSERIPCPRCRGKTWLEDVDGDVVQRCLCGLHRYVKREVDGLTIMCVAVGQSDVKIPAIGTKIHKCLLSVAQSHPKPIQTADVVQQTSLTIKETSALLITLMARGLIIRHEGRHGMKGGSTWLLSPPSETHFKKHYHG